MPSLPRLAGRAAKLVHEAREVSLGRWDIPLLLGSLAAVIGIRLQLLVGTDFPINDGALFYVFVQDIARVFPHLPASVDYNGLSIPFAYPPLSFWVSAALVRLGFAPLGLVHYLPILLNIGWVLLFTSLLLRLGFSRLFTAFAVFVFGTTFRSYEWLVMGGGLSRGFGSLFFLLTLIALLPPGLWRGTGWSWRRLVVGGVFLGATILSHLEWGLLGTFCALVSVAVAKARPVRFLQAAVLLGVVSGLLVLPWIASVVQVHGLAPFQAASQASQWTFNVLRDAGRILLNNAMLLLPLLVVGTLLILRTREVFWLVLVGAALLLIPRSGETPLVLGIAVLTTLGFFGVLAALARRPGRNARPALVALSIGVLALTGVRAADALRRDEKFAPLHSEVRGAMAWVAANHPGAGFAVVRDAPWAYNATAEWFPVLAHATNMTTVQGREWLPERNFDRVYTAVETLDDSASCPQLLQSLANFPGAQFVWTEGIDLRSRAITREFIDRPKSAGDRLRSLKRRLRGQPLVDKPPAEGALHGPGTAAGCLDAEGWQEVYANRRVRIFRAPAADASVAQGSAASAMPQHVAQPRP